MHCEAAPPECERPASGQNKCEDFALHLLHASVLRTDHVISSALLVRPASLLFAIVLRACESQDGIEDEREEKQSDGKTNALAKIGGDRQDH